METIISGGILMGLGASLLYLGVGRIAGVSGIMRGAAGHPAWNWRTAFLAGLVMSSLVTGALLETPAPESDVPWVGLAAAGLLCGVGATVGNGCTSGHALCGVARLSPRSLVAATLYCVFGAAATLVVR